MVQLIITGVNLFVLCFCLGYFLSPMISRMLSKRTAQIADTLAQAGTSREDARQELLLYQQKLENFDEERAALLMRAQEKARLRETQILTEANAEAQRIVERARREADLLRAKLKDDVRSDMITVSTAAAARMIEDHMDEALQDVFIDETLKEMGEMTWRS